MTSGLIPLAGRRVRANSAEGLLARRTNVLVGSLGVQELINEDDVQRVRTARREDLPGEPLVWQAALRNLLAELTASGELRVR